mmetsp:Transcript_145915/g.406452  ORF Transcript_145915/g.406452 Transcript_145915/m.406452 type:complete len:226 (+) Transcript_145915:1158-1835(+)
MFASRVLLHGWQHARQQPQKGAPLQLHLHGPATAQLSSAVSGRRDGVPCAPRTLVLQPRCDAWRDHVPGLPELQRPQPHAHVRGPHACRGIWQANHLEDAHSRLSLQAEAGLTSRCNKQVADCVDEHSANKSRVGDEGVGAGALAGKLREEGAVDFVAKAGGAHRARNAAVITDVLLQIRDHCVALLRHAICEQHHVRQPRCRPSTPAKPRNGPIPRTAQLKPLL